MNRQALIFVTLIVVAGAAAWGLGLFSSEPAPPPTETAASAAPTPTRPDTPTTEAPDTPARTTPAPERTPGRTPTPAEPEVIVPAAPTTATLTIDSDVPGAQVFVDNKFIGTAPAVANDIQPGQRKINVQAPGYESVAEFIDVTPGPRSVTISLKTIRLDKRVAVTHKHGIGSCKGTLIATPAGIRYETDNRDHAFSVALTNLETFEVDYIQKNLKLKVRGGKSYDFTDPSGSADAIYLFHQEVEKVRQRLLKEGGR